VTIPPPDAGTDRDAPRDPAHDPARTTAPITDRTLDEMEGDDAPPSANVTQLLAAWGAGDREALDALLPAVYVELRRQARRALQREAAGHTLQPTALVHEAYLRLVDQRPARFESRSQFFGVAARCMRQVLVDAARTRQAAKRGGGAQAVTLSDVDAAGAAAERDVDVIALDEALQRLAAIDPDQARLVELRYFAGLTLDETAAALGVSAATVSREWSVARRWLRRELER
jgi:RNA polymerase sigma factor (TIGR02999 family)